jgi:hypothetical protein
MLKCILPKIKSIVWVGVPSKCWKIFQVCKFNFKLIICHHVKFKSVPFWMVLCNLSIDYRNCCVHICIQSKILNSFHILKDMYVSLVSPLNASGSICLKPLLDKSRVPKFIRYFSDWLCKICICLKDISKWIVEFGRFDGTDVSLIWEKSANPLIWWYVHSVLAAWTPEETIQYVNGY